MRGFTVILIMVGVIIVCVDHTASSTPMMHHHHHPPPTGIRPRREQQSHFGPPQNIHRQSNPSFNPANMRHGPPKPRYNQPKPHYGLLLRYGQGSPPKQRFQAYPKTGPNKIHYGPPRPHGPPKYYGSPKQHYGSPKPYPVKQSYNLPKPHYTIPNPGHNFHGPPATSYGYPLRKKPLSSYDVPSNSISNSYGAASKPMISYGRLPDITFDATKLNYGVQENFQTPPNTFDSPEISYGAPKPSSSYGSPALLKNFAPHKPSNSYELPSTNNFGASSFNDVSLPVKFQSTAANNALKYSFNAAEDALSILNNYKPQQPGSSYESGTNNNILTSPSNAAEDSMTNSNDYIPTKVSFEKPVKSIMQDIPDSTSFSNFHLGSSNPSDMKNNFDSFTNSFNNYVHHTQNSAHSPSKTKNSHHPQQNSESNIHSSGHGAPEGFFNSNSFDHSSQGDSTYSPSNTHTVKTPNNTPFSHGYSKPDSYMNGDWNYNSFSGAPDLQGAFSNSNAYDTISGSLRESYEQNNEKHQMSHQDNYGAASVNTDSQSVSSSGTSFQAPSQTYRFVPSKSQEQDQPDVKFPETETKSVDYRQGDVSASYNTGHDVLSPNYFDNYDTSQYGEKINVKMQVKGTNQEEERGRRPIRNRVKFNKEKSEDEVSTTSNQSEADNKAYMVHEDEEYSEMH